ncbi:MAG: leucine-rich repeat protein [Clostridia bacterium]|nr:leucine-rich repeat protein [Clostridia bacterium]
MKRTLSLLICLVLCMTSVVITPVHAARDISNEEIMAQYLKDLGLFKGVSENNMDLERVPTRLEALVMLIRVLGEEKAALEGNYHHPFTDVPAWADAYVGYAYEKGLTKGVSDTQFGTQNASATTYLTFILRALGYSDVNGVDFSWDDPYALAARQGILSDTVDTDNFLRADAVTVSYLALFSHVKNTSQTLSEKLVKGGAIEAEKQQGLQTPDEIGISKEPAGEIISIRAAAVDEDGYLIITLTSGEQINAGLVRGKDGKDGQDGKNGSSGSKGATGENGVGIQSVELNGEGHLIVTLSDGSSNDAGAIAGVKGEKGEKGDKGDTGAQGIQGEKGDKGDKGDTGAQGVDGKSAYELYKEAYPSYTGTLEEWLAALKGDKGDKGDAGAQGIQGEKGEKGDKGDAGRGILSTGYENGFLTITYTDDTEDVYSVNVESDGTDGLAYYPLTDGTYGVKAGTTQYLDTIVIPSTYNNKAVTQILENGFKDMLNLKKITIPESIIAIQPYAFSGCSALESADIPSSVTSIGQYAFYNCSSLTKIVIPENISTIEYYCFYGCNAVNNQIIIPKSVTAIRPYALKISSSKEIYFEEAGTWKVTESTAHYLSTGIHGTTSNYFNGLGGPKVFVVQANNTTNYSDYFWGKQLHFSVPLNSNDFYLRSEECDWTKQ